MAGNKLKYHMAASTIMEVVVSMIVIVIVFGIAMMIFSNVMRRSIPAKKIRAKAILQGLMFKAQQSKINTTRTFTIEDFSIEEKVAPYKGSSNLTSIKLTAYDRNQQKVEELQEIINMQP